jgi:hypothetical protein
VGIGRVGAGTGSSHAPDKATTKIAAIGSRPVDITRVFLEVRISGSGHEPAIGGSFDLFHTPAFEAATQSRRQPNRSPETTATLA